MSAPEYEECPGVATGPESRASQTPQWLSFVDELAQEVADADDKEVRTILTLGIHRQEAADSCLRINPQLERGGVAWTAHYHLTSITSAGI